MSFGLRHVAPLLPAFLQTYPEISIDLRLDDRIVDLVAGGFDLALRIADMPDSSLVARRLCPVRRWIVGDPAYFAKRGTPERPKDLKDHSCLGYSYLVSGETWHFSNAQGAEEAVTIRGPLTATNADALQAALEAGTGIALQPDFLVWKAIRAGRLVAVMREWTSPPLNLSLVTPSSGPRAPRVTVLYDFLVRHLSAGNAPWTLAGNG
jgi:DNA-binding transcriptional LysR family regulator